jgi:CBS domain-containing protein
MVDHGVGSVIVTDDGTPAGLLTETDALEASAPADRPIEAISAADVMNRPVEATATVSHICGPWTNTGSRICQ